MVYLLIPVMILVSFALAWMWWSGRLDRDPVSSVDGWHRALDAMQPTLNERSPASDNEEGTTTSVG